jgi:hypothetical protein
MNQLPYRNFGRRKVQTGSARAPLIIAIVAALITYAAFGTQTPFGFLHHLGHPKITINTDKSADAAEDSRQAALDRIQEAADRAQQAADKAQERADHDQEMRDRAQELKERSEELGQRTAQIAEAQAAKALAAALPPIPPAPPIPTVSPVPPVPAVPPVPGVPSADTEVRGLDPFDSVTIDNGTATITIGDSQKVSITNSLGHTETHVRDGKLTISGAGATVAITMPHLKALQVNGYGTVSLKGLRDPIAIKANGAVQLSASGTVESADLIMNGPSKFDFAKLQTKNLTVQVNGVGDADVYATDNLTADVKGVGHVRYRGDPHLVTKINGPGTVQRVAADAG